MYLLSTCCSVHLFCRWEEIKKLNLLTPTAEPPSYLPGPDLLLEPLPVCRSVHPTLLPENHPCHQCIREQPCQPTSSHTRYKVYLEQLYFLLYVILKTRMTSEFIWYNVNIPVLIWKEPVLTPPQLLLQEPRPLSLQRTTRYCSLQIYMLSISLMIMMAYIT